MDFSKISTGLCNVATVTPPTSTAVGMVSAISEALFTAKEALVQTNQYASNPAGYAGVARGIINEILRCKNMSNKIESL